MIAEVKTGQGLDAITSNQWHVVHSRLLCAGTKRPFARRIASEHPDRESCCAAAKLLRERVGAASAGVPIAEREEVFVRRPNFKSLKLARQRLRRRP